MLWAWGVGLRAYRAVSNQGSHWELYSKDCRSISRGLRSRLYRCSFETLTLSSHFRECPRLVKVSRSPHPAPASTSPIQGKKANINLNEALLGPYGAASRMVSPNSVAPKTIKQSLNSVSSCRASCHWPPRLQMAPVRVGMWRHEPCT